MSSLDSHTMVPTLTMFGRVSECTLLDSKLVVAAVEVTWSIMTCLWRRTDTGSGFEGDRVRTVIRPSDHPSGGAFE